MSLTTYLEMAALYCSTDSAGTTFEASIIARRVSSSDMASSSAAMAGAAPCPSSKSDAAIARRDIVSAAPLGLPADLGAASPEVLNALVIKFPAGRRALKPALVPSGPSRRIVLLVG